MKFFTFLAFLCGFACIVRAQQTIVITELANYEAVGYDKLLYLEDPQHNISLTAFRQMPASSLIKATTEYTNFGISASAFWVTFKVCNATNKRCYIRLMNPLLDTARLYIFSKNELIEQKDILARRPELLLPNSPFSLPDRTGDTLTCYLRVFAKVPAAIPITVMHQDTMVNSVFNLAMGDLLFFGAILVMICYNLFIGIVTRVRAYLYYVGYSFFIGLTTFFLKGYPIVILGKYSFVVDDNFAIIVSMASVFLTLFTLDFLQVKKQFKWGYWLLQASIAGQFVVMAIFLLGYVNLNVTLYQFVNAFNNIIIIIVSFRLYRNYKPARIFSIAFLCYVSLGTAINLTFANLLPFSISILYFVHIGASIELILFSIALANKINDYRKEKEDAQRKTIALIQEQNVVLEQKVTERTHELNLQKNTLEEKNKHIMQNINYAKRIQEAFLPKRDAIAQVLPQFFIFFRPRDVVSGDFYFVKQEEAKTIVGVIDCTGHGVSGAFMTVLGNEILHKLVDNDHITSPDLLLNQLHKGVRQALQQGETENRDGMDATLITIDRRNRVVEFAGAKNPLLAVKNGELTVYKADKMPIGGEQKEAERIFTKTTIETDGQTRFYLFSDGFQDQFGGPDDRKFMIKQLKELFAAIAYESMPMQHDLLAQAFDNWKGTGNQTDDVLVMGLIA